MKKTFTVTEIRDLLNQVYREEISFSGMVDIMNERVSEFKDGDFVVGPGCVFIVHKQLNNYSAEYYVLYAKTNGKLWYDKIYWQRGGIDKLELATEAEKQELLDILAKGGKRWNEERLCVEDIPKRKFQKGDKVRIKEGVLSETHGCVYPYFTDFLSQYMGKVMTVEKYITNNIGEYVTTCEAKEGNHPFGFSEDWLEPYTDELKKGDLAIFWDDNKRYAVIKLYERLKGSEEWYYKHEDNNRSSWRNAIKFESREQYEKLLKGEL